MSEFNLLELLDYIDPSLLQYNEWLNVGMALKYEGYTAYDWEQWSSKDVARYIEGECYNKWDTFTDKGITGATITQYAKDFGYWESNKKEYKEIGWNDTIIVDNDDYKLIQSEWLENVEIKPYFKTWDPIREFKTYIETLFELDDNVGYVNESYLNIKNRWVPNQGFYDRKTRVLLKELKQAKVLEEVIGDYQHEAGAWIRFNPLDGLGVKNANVTDYRYALVECDNQEIEKQYAILKELELPIACIVYSGKKSLHAIVKVFAQDLEEYKKRVDYIYTVCNRNGLEVDTQNKNPSRLSRMPGVIRGDKKQFIVDINIGKKDYDTWVDYIEDLNDGLPDIECLSDYWDNLPPLAEELIQGVLRVGHKMLIAGQSKAGKSFLLMNLTISIAEGLKWIGWQCKQGKVLYINLELDRASCLHRFKEIYNGLGIKPQALNNIEIWNLRGKSVPMDKLAPKIIRRSIKKRFIAVIIDPIYKVLTGDENSADQMAHFTNQFDKVATELSTSVIYCHHHSKGSQGDKKAMDRASGSGVFARDPDALIDLIELPLNEHIIKCENDKIKAEYYYEQIKNKDKEYFEKEIAFEDIYSVHQMDKHLKAVFSNREIEKILKDVNYILETKSNKTAWRIDGTLREFAKFKPKNIWFDYPKHWVDDKEVLTDIDTEEAKPSWKKTTSKGKHPEDKKDKKFNELEVAYASLELEGKKEITYDDLVEEMEKSKRTIIRLVNKHPYFETEKGESKQTIIIRKD